MFTLNLEESKTREVLEVEIEVGNVIKIKRQTIIVYDAHECHTAIYCPCLREFAVNWCTFDSGLESVSILNKELLFKVYGLGSIKHH